MSATRTSLIAIALLASACLTREVSKEQPTTKLSFDTRLPAPTIDKLDLLVVVDNSTSMRDKQVILAKALPDLLSGLVSPKCVDPLSRVPNGSVADTTRPLEQQCPVGSEPAFRPITDMHIGVISTSLGGFGVECKPAPGRIDDDKAHLLARGPDGQPVAAAGDLHFLAWYPDVLSNQDKKRHPDPPVPKTTNLPDLTTSFQALVEGVGDNGCGIEAQLESTYRFLSEAAPPESISVQDGKPVVGPVDRKLLEQRAKFLRPDSLVAVVMLTDEEDASVDPGSFSGTGWRFLQSSPLPRATSTCAVDPTSKECTSCSFEPTDPSCATNGGLFSPAEDQLNVRFHRMKPRYGVDPRFPIDRYVDGFREKTLGKCTNPLFAATLPEGKDGEELCQLPLGPRTAAHVYFAVIGGVPSGLVYSDSVDWTKILGRDPAKNDFQGIDPHMIDSTEPRSGLPGPSAPASADPVHGREWTTNGGDLQLACAFDLPTERKCDGTQYCDCDGKKDIPLCKPNALDVQIRGKAYPTLRELSVAKELGSSGIPASLCPIQLSDPSRDDYGYRPAVRSILDVFGRGPAACLPRALERTGPDGAVPCLVVATFRDEGSDSECTRFGLAPPNAALLAQVRERVREEQGEAAARRPICEIPQRAVPEGDTCRLAKDGIGFCYTRGAPGTHCTNALEFTKPAEELVGATFSLQCIQLTSSN